MRKQGFLNEITPCVFPKRAAVLPFWNEFSSDKTQFNWLARVWRHGGKLQWSPIVESSADNRGGKPQGYLFRLWLLSRVHSMEAWGIFRQWLQYRTVPPGGPSKDLVHPWTIAQAGCQWGNHLLVSFVKAQKTEKYCCRLLYTWIGCSTLQKALSNKERHTHRCVPLTHVLSPVINELPT